MLDTEIESEERCSEKKHLISCGGIHQWCVIPYKLAYSTPLWYSTPPLIVPPPSGGSLS